MSGYLKMDPEFKERWIDALESGEYEQGKGKLCRDGKFCCLGVAADVAEIPFETEAMGPNALPTRVYVFGPGGRHLSGIPTNWKGISPAAQKRLWRMNDSRGKTFAEIAQWIRENL